MTLSFAPERIEQWPIARLQPYARNAKTHGADQVAKIAASMAEFGWTVPCLVAEDGELIAGHGRVLAATQLGLTEAPVIVLGHLTEAQRRAYRIADNRLTESPWDEALLSAELNDLLAEDFDLSLVGFSDGELDKLLAYVPEGEGAEGGGANVPPVVIPEPPRNPASRTGDLWILGEHRLLCGDSTSVPDVRRLMNGERAILFATDPPYLVDYDGSNHPTRNKDWSQSYGVTWDDSSQGAELYDGFIAAAVAEAITEDAAWYCWHASRRQAMLEACWEKAGAFVHQQIIWVKDRGVLTRSHYLWKHEPCFMGWIRGNRPPKVAEETLASTWALPSFAKVDRPDHPTPKPLDAFGIPMRQHVARGGLCYEPFCGSGSQIMAGEANGRRVFAMEISPAYIDVAVERWQADTGRDAILESENCWHRLQPPQASIDSFTRQICVVRSGKQPMTLEFLTSSSGSPVQNSPRPSPCTAKRCWQGRFQGDNPHDPAFRRGCLSVRFDWCTLALTMRSESGGNWAEESANGF